MCSAPTLSTFALDVRRSDYLQMMLHHLVTIVLLSMGYTVNFVRAGTLIILTHDTADILLELGKLFRYAQWSVDALTDLRPRNMPRSLQVHFGHVRVHRLSMHLDWHETSLFPLLATPLNDLRRPPAHPGELPLGELNPGLSSSSSTRREN
jgi:hypothetical protein